MRLTEPRGGEPVSTINMKPQEPRRATEARLRAIIAKRDEFMKTPIGSAFRAFENAHGQAWRVDTQESYAEWPKEGLMKRKWEQEKAARTELLKLLYEAAGCGEYDEGR